MIFEVVSGLDALDVPVDPLGLGEVLIQRVSKAQAEVLEHLQHGNAFLVADSNQSILIG